jgi:hypothetical protein
MGRSFFQIESGNGQATPLSKFAIHQTILTEKSFACDEKEQIPSSDR